MLFIKGKIIRKISEENVIVDTGSIGYNIKISAGTAALLPGIGEEVKIHTYTCVREDAFNLYGFLTRDDLEIFKRLITVNGIGPKGGLAICFCNELQMICGLLLFQETQVP